MSPKDFNQNHRTMEQVMLDHMKLCHPEWLDELAESGELDDLITAHVEMAAAMRTQFGNTSAWSGAIP